MACLWRKHSHQLLKGPERLALLEERLFLNADVREERSVMEGIEPRPAGHPTIVVFIDPAQGLDIRHTDISSELHELLGFYPKLFTIVFLFVAVEFMTED